MPKENDPRGYLETEFRIIAEDETHAVLALRVEKSIIQRSLPFLAALACLSPSASVKTPVE